MLNDNDSQALETPLIYDAREYANAKTHEHSSSLPDLSTRQKIIETRKLPPGCPPGWRVGFDSNKKARLFDQNGKIVNEPTKKMSSHHSSQGSTTQENSPWMYDQHNHSWSAAVEGETSQASLQPDKPSTTVSSVNRSQLLTSFVLIRKTEHLHLRFRRMILICNTAVLRIHFRRMILGISI